MCPCHFEVQSFTERMVFFAVIFVAVMGLHDDVIKWKHFPHYWPPVRGIHRSPVNSPHKGQWRGALMFTLICARIIGWVNNRKAGDLRRYRHHYDVIVMGWNYGMDGQHTSYHNREKILYSFLKLWILSSFQRSKYDVIIYHKGRSASYTVVFSLQQIAWYSMLLQWTINNNHSSPSSKGID